MHPCELPDLPGLLEPPLACADIGQHVQVPGSFLAAPPSPPWTSVRGCQPPSHPVWHKETSKAGLTFASQSSCCVPRLVLKVNGALVVEGVLGVKVAGLQRAGHATSLQSDPTTPGFQPVLPCRQRQVVDGATAEPAGPQQPVACLKSEVMACKSEASQVLIAAGETRMRTAQQDSVSQQSPSVAPFRADRTEGRVCFCKLKLDCRTRLYRCCLLCAFSVDWAADTYMHKTLIS